MLTANLVVAATWILVLAGVAFVFARLRSRRTHIGAAAAGAVYEMLNQDKRNAIEIIVEEKAAEADPERADGDLPHLEQPRR